MSLAYPLASVSRSQALTNILPVEFASNHISPNTMGLSSTDVAVLGLSAAVAGIYLYRGSIMGSSTKPPPIANKNVARDDGIDPRDFVAKMKANVRLFYRSVVH